MKTSDALAYADNSPPKLAEMLGISPHAIYQWGEIVPELSAAKMEKITDGKLVYDFSFYRSIDAAKKEQKAAA